MKLKDYPDNPQTLGQHLKKRRKELGLLQREVASRIGVTAFTIVNWEKDRTKPVPAQFKPVFDFLGFDPSPAPVTLVERLQAKRRELGVTFEQVAQYLRWNVGSLTRYLNGTWHMSLERAEALDRFFELTSPAAQALRDLPRRLRR